MRLERLILFALLYAAVPPLIMGCQARSAEPDVETAMTMAATFFRDQLSVQGSYVWEYNPSDLSERRGEGITTLSQGWSEPPGTPAVGLAYLAAFKATGQPSFLEAAKETGQALIKTQLESGGWQGLLEFDAIARKSWCYRVDAGHGRPDCETINDNDLKNATSLDDNISQAPLTFLMRLDAALQGSASEVREAAIYGLSRFLEAQYPNGAWPFRFDLKVPNAFTNSAWRARYPADWPRTFVQPEGEVYVVNDHLMRDVIRLFLLAYDTYGEPVYLAAAKRGGDFLLAAQMPEPQPGWAQTYNENLEPTWGRPFEPPSIASNETAGSIQALLELYAATGEQRYLDGVRPAVRWLARSRLSDDNWSRFYELGSNLPLYVDTDYKVTHSYENLPDHYKFINSFGIMRVLGDYKKVATHDGALPGETDISPVPKKARAMGLIEALDEQGRWIGDGTIASGTFVKRMVALASFVAAGKGEKLPDYLGPVKHQLDR